MSWEMPAGGLKGHRGPFFSEDAAQKVLQPAAVGDIFETTSPSSEGSMFYNSNGAAGAQEAEAEEGSEELVYAGVPATQRREAFREATIQSPSYTRREIISQTALRQPEADAFLTQIFPWGQDGHEFMAALQSHLQELAVSHMERYGEEKHYLTNIELREYIQDLCNNAGDFISYRDQREVASRLIARACDAGLLIHQTSFGYRPRPEEPTELYVFNQDPAAVAMLGSEVLADQTPLNFDMAQELLSDELLVRDPRNPLSKTLTSKDFYRFFEEPHTASEAYMEPSFYENEKTEYRATYVAPLVDALIEQGLAAGILLEIQSGEQRNYTLASEAKKLLS